MTTRWFVEVSPVDADTLKERYCVEAIQWQQALQQARKIRGDRGPLSRFSIELLDAGYRATDPSSKIRYTVSKAPVDAPLTAGAGSNGAAPAPAPLPKEAPAAAIAVKEAPARPAPTVAAVPSGAPAQAAVLRASKPDLRADAAVSSRQSSIPKPSVSKAPAHRSSTDAGPPRPSVRNSSAAIDRAPVAAVSVRSAAVPAENATPIDAIPLVNMQVPKPVVAPPSQEPAPPVSEPVFPLTAPATNVEEPAPAPPPPAHAPSAPEGEPVPSLPGLELVAVRREEPREGVPIVYREYAFAVSPGMSQRELERYARAAWEQARSLLAPRTHGKFVQIAIFDHKFAARPERPPLAVLAWKDWRGDPVIQIRGAAASAPAPAPAPVPAPALAPAAAPAPVAASLPVSVPAPVAAPVATSIPVNVPAPVAAPADIPAPAVTAPEPVPVPVIAEAPFAAPAPVEADASVPSLAHALKPAMRAPPPVVAPRRRGPAEDLISELFEEMHQLHFMPDLIAGAEYVASVLANVLPCEGSIVHVFDINTRNFVVVRAWGPKSSDVLLHRTPDTFAHFREAFRRGRALAFTPEGGDERVQRELWDRLGVEVHAGLCGAVQQAGRYLGVIELANPLGGPPFHVGELNALDYICEQFADFIAQKPIVLDADAVIPRQ